MEYHSTQRRRPTRFFLSLTLLSLLITLTVPPVAPTPSTSTTKFAATEYIRTSCATTENPAECFSSLSRFAGSVHQDPTRLAQAAIRVALSRTRKAASYVSTLSDPPSSAVLRDCVTVLDSASSALSDSLTQLKKITAADASTRNAKEFRSLVGDVQMQITVASTYDRTCLNGFGSGPEGGPLSGSGSPKVKAQVFQRVGEVVSCTDTALDLFVKAYSAYVDN